MTPSVAAAASHDHGSGLIVEPVGVWGQRAVVDERHEGSRRYPEPLMTVRRVRVGGFTVALDLELPSEPQPASPGGRLLELALDAVERVIRGFDPDPGAVDGQKRHDDSPSGGDGQVLVTPDGSVDRTLEGAADTEPSGVLGGGAVAAVPAAAPEGGEAS